TAILHDDDPAAGLPLVTVAVIDAGATEAPGDPAAFRVQRAGNTTASLTVDYEIAGSATAGLDYQPLSGSVTLAAGAATALVVVAPIQDQAPEATETVVLRLAAGSTYALGGARTAHVTIADDDRAGSLPIVGVIATEPTVGEPADHGIVTITRTGLPLQPLTVRLATTGTATSGHDYIALPATAVIPTGQRWVRLPIHVLDEPLVEGTESLNVELLPDPTYRIGVAAAATFWLDDDEAVPLPPGPVGLAIGPLAANAVGTATVTGGAPSGFLTIWVGLAPGYLVVPPFGALGLDTMVSGAFVSALFDSTGTATLALPMPGLELVGLRTWWQAFATTAAAPFGALSPTLARELIGAGVR
ncbi:MAG: hypothetical protein KDE27_30020, partial [Planctomycetes bacterium]|nr:hypothetical protein [Planctomycetota bacterium]